MFTVVIPTMWKYPPFLRFVQKVADHHLVSEVIVIDNDQSSRPYVDPFDRGDIKLICTGQNNFVNPSWNMGIAQAENENVCVMNDDVTFDLRVFNEIEPFMMSPHFGVAGAHPGEIKLHQIPFKDGNIDVVPWESPQPGKSHGYLFGFGTLFFVKKSTYVTIPDALSVYYGDDWIHFSQSSLGRQIWLITNLFYHSPSAQTCTSVFTEEQRTQMLEVEGDIFRREIAIFRDSLVQNHLEFEYKVAVDSPSDINEHLPILRSLANECERVTELGVREGCSTRAFLVHRNKLRSYDLYISPHVNHLFDLAKSVGRDFQYIMANSLEIDLEECDMLFIDTDHTYDQLSKELKKHHSKVNKYIALHDTVSYKNQLMPAITVFLSNNPEWSIKDHYTNNNGLMVLEKK